MPINDFLTCPTDCTTAVTLPAISAVQDCSSYDQDFSQVWGFIYRPMDNSAPDPYTDWATTPTATVGAIDNTEALNAKCKQLVGIGGVDVPELTVNTYPKKTERVVNREYTLRFRVLQLDAANYEFLRKLQCGSTDFTFYYENMGDWVFGKVGGIEPKSIDVEFPLGSGDDDKQYAEIIVKWDADADPERRVDPLA